MGILLFNLERFNVSEPQQYVLYPAFGMKYLKTENVSIQFLAFSLSRAQILLCCNAERPRSTGVLPAIRRIRHDRKSLKHANDFKSSVAGWQACIDAGISKNMPKTHSTGDAKGA